MGCSNGGTASSNTGSLAALRSIGLRGNGEGFVGYIWGSRDLDRVRLNERILIRNRDRVGDGFRGQEVEGDDVTACVMLWVPPVCERKKKKGGERCGWSWAARGQCAREEVWAASAQHRPWPFFSFFCSFLFSFLIPVFTYKYFKTFQKSLIKYVLKSL